MNHEVGGSSMVEVEEDYRNFTKHSKHKTKNQYQYVNHTWQEYTNDLNIWIVWIIDINYQIIDIINQGGGKEQSTICSEVVVVVSSIIVK